MQDAEQYARHQPHQRDFGRVYPFAEEARERQAQAYIGEMNAEEVVVQVAEEEREDTGPDSDYAE